MTPQDRAAVAALANMQGAIADAIARINTIPLCSDNGAELARLDVLDGMNAANATLETALAHWGAVQ